VLKVALVLGIPVEFEEFSQRVSCSDWLSKFNDPELNEAERETSLRARWNSEYSPLVAEPLQELIATATKMDALVCPRSTLATLTTLTSEYQVVILFAHWKGSEILNADLIAPIQVSDLIERVHGDQTWIGSWLEAQLKMLVSSRQVEGVGRRLLNRWLGLFRRRQRLSLRNVPSEGMALSAKRPRPGTNGVDYVLECNAARIAHERDHLDSTLQGLLLPGNRLELFDGMHSKEAVESAVWQQFEGIIDFTTCTSTVLEDYIATKRKHKLRTIQFPTVQEFFMGCKMCEYCPATCLGTGLIMPASEEDRRFHA
jgi:hypothetical protein